MDSAISLCNEWLFFVIYDVIMYNTLKLNLQQFCCSVTHYFTPCILNKYFTRLFKTNHHFYTTPPQTNKGCKIVCSTLWDVNIRAACNCYTFLICWLRHLDFGQENWVFLFLLFYYCLHKLKFDSYICG